MSFENRLSNIGFYPYDSPQNKKKIGFIIIS